MRAITQAMPRAASSSASTRPVSMNAQAEALTARLSAWPRWVCQSAAAMRSSISASAVAASGMRSRASARHSSATPSAVPRPYSCRKSVTSAPGRCAGAGGAHQGAGARADRGGLCRRQRGGIQQGRELLGFGRPVQGTQRRAIVRIALQQGRCRIWHGRILAQSRQPRSRRRRQTDGAMRRSAGVWQATRGG